MAEFNKVWVNCVEDENLYGKYGYFSDNIDSLKMYVTEDNPKCYGRLVEYSTSMSSFPFMREDDGECYRFFYHDPHWSKPELPSRIVTHSELAQWLAQGNGEGLYINSSETPHLTFTELRYLPVDGNQSVQGIVVRWWNEDEWHVPSETYLGMRPTENED